MSRNKGRFGRHFRPRPAGRIRTVRFTMFSPLSSSKPPSAASPIGAVARSASDATSWWRASLACWLSRGALALAWTLALVCVAWGQTAAPQAALPADASLALRAEVGALLSQQKVAQGEGAGSSAARSPWRVAFELGELDPRLRLAPCQRIQAYLPAGARLWGRTRVGLRCEQGPVRWNVFWPVTVRVWGQAVVAAAPLRPGEPLTAADLKLAEVDLAAEPAPAVLQPAALIGRSVTRALEAGHALRTSDVRPRRWFALGDTVTVNVLGDGFHVQAEGRAMAHGDEGQCARIRAENGRTVCAMPVGERLAELRL